MIRPWYFSILLVMSLFQISCNAQTTDRIWQEAKKEEHPKQQEQTLTQSDLDRLNIAFSGLAKKLSPSVVNIYTRTKIEAPRVRGFENRPQDELFRFFFGNPFGPFSTPMLRETSSLGSGFIINEEKGYIITNSHVVRQNGRNATEIMVKFIGKGRGKGYKAEIIGVDETVDVALLKVKKKKKGIKAVVLGDSSKINVGEWVVAIGNPYGHAHTVTQGIISALGRDLDISNADFIQTSASINPGNSGGPLFNLKGEVIGINTAIDARAQGIGFAVPINTAKNVVKQLLEHGEVRRGWLGIGIGDVTEDLAKQLNLPESSGAFVQGVEKGNPAEKAGLKIYDVIVGVDGSKVETAKDLSTVVSNIEPEKTVNVELYRDGKKKTLKVRLGKRPTDPQFAAGDVKNDKSAESLARKAGFSLSNLTPENRSRYRIPHTIKSGAVVLHVYPGTAAGFTGVRSGDVVVEINKRKVKGANDAEKKIAKAIKNKERLMLRLIKPSGVSVVVILDLSEAN